VVVSGPDDYCYQHDPSRAAERRRNASKAARSKPNREIARIKAALNDLYAAVEMGQLSPSVGAILNQITNTKLRSIEAERRIREQEELEVRLAGVEARLEELAEVGSSRWRA
jgi:hypothetical protein